MAASGRKIFRTPCKKNGQTLSNHYLEKKVVIGYRQFPNVIEYEVVFEIPSGENHFYAQFESLTGYMPSIFKDFYCLNLAMRIREPLSDGPGEQKHTVIFATGNHDFAMGIYSPQQPSPGYEAAGYGRFRFKIRMWSNGTVFFESSPNRQSLQVATGFSISSLSGTWIRSPKPCSSLPPPVKIVAHGSPTAAQQSNSITIKGPQKFEIQNRGRFPNV
ncbi:MAG: hypothetical protein VX768_11405, partial [Planctomycetota bacterium]|nr:hypothetical protein [Planctomycetota bacterium]